MGYVPPQLRNAVNYTPRNLSIKQRVEIIDYTKVKTKVQVYEEIRKKEYGKADAAWEE